MVREIRVALVGAGLAGQSHAFGYRNAAMAPELDGLRVILDTVVDPNLELAASVAKRFGFERYAASIDEVLMNPGIEAISVALPNNQYMSVLPRVLAAGKHVLAEKPLGVTEDEAMELTRLADATDVIAGVGFSFRRIPGLAAARETVVSGRIGKPYFARAYYYTAGGADPEAGLNWRYLQDQSGGGALVDIGAHAIDAVQHFLGPALEVQGAVLTTSILERPLPDGGRGAVTNDDTALLTLGFGDGVTAAVQLSRVTAGVPNSLGIEVFGSGGHVRFDTGDFNGFSLFVSDPADPSNGPRFVTAGPAMPHYSGVTPMPAQGVSTGYGEAFLAEVQEFLGCILSGHPMDTDFATATRTMHVIAAAQRSAVNRQAELVRV